MKTITLKLTKEERGVLGDAIVDRLNRKRKSGLTIESIRSILSKLDKEAK